MLNKELDASCSNTRNLSSKASSERTKHSPQLPRRHHFGSATPSLMNQILMWAQPRLAIPSLIHTKHRRWTTLLHWLTTMSVTDLLLGACIKILTNKRQRSSTMIICLSTPAWIRCKELRTTGWSAILCNYLSLSWEANLTRKAWKVSPCTARERIADS